jgi:hypothetical protein
MAYIAHSKQPTCSSSAFDAQFINFHVLRSEAKTEKVLAAWLICHPLNRLYFSSDIALFALRFDPHFGFEEVGLAERKTIDMKCDWIIHPNRRKLIVARGSTCDRNLVHFDHPEVWLWDNHLAHQKSER